MVLAKALVDKEKEMSGTNFKEVGHLLPTMPLHEARQVMTRADFIQSYDQVTLKIWLTNGKAIYLTLAQGQSLHH